MTANAVARRMALCCRQLAARGLLAGRDGNISVRLGPDRVLVTPSGLIKAFLVAVAATLPANWTYTCGS